MLLRETELAITACILQLAIYSVQMTAPTTDAAGESVILVDTFEEYSVSYLNLNAFLPDRLAM